MKVSIPLSSFYPSASPRLRRGGDHAAESSVIPPEERGIQLKDTPPILLNIFTGIPYICEKYGVGYD